MPNNNVTTDEQGAQDLTQKIKDRLREHPDVVARGGPEVWTAVASEIRSFLNARPVAQSGEVASMTRMLDDACSDLGTINEALGLDREEAGAGPILSAIEELKSRAAVVQPSSAAEEALAKRVFGGINALRWLLNITTEFDRKDVRTRQAARLLDQFFTKDGVTNRVHLERLWKALHDQLSTEDVIDCLRAMEVAPPQQADQALVETQLMQIAGRAASAATKSDKVLLSDWDVVFARALLAASAAEPAQGDSADHEFKNFHRLLCERFNYTHDERDWKRDQISLIEHIARRGAEIPGREGEAAVVSALRRIDAACDEIARLRTREQYLSMIDSGQTDALYELDNARAHARKLVADHPAEPLTV